MGGALIDGELMDGELRKSIIKRVYVPTCVRQLPNGERVIVPGHYRKPTES